MKPTLLILHGALGCKEQFTAWIQALSGRFDCHAFDFSGHGIKSAEINKFSIEAFSEDLKKYIEANNLNQPHVLGYSMGGYVALFTALRDSAPLGNIMTISTKFDWNKESSQKEAGYLKPAMMLQKVPQLAGQLKQRHGSHWENVVEKTAEMMLLLGEKPLLINENIGGIKNKIKFCVGDQDKMVSMDETMRMFRGANNAELCVLPATAHLPETMNPKRIVFEVEEFLLNSSSPRASRG